MNRIPSKKEMQEALKQRHGAFLQEKFSRSAVAVCGLGGLGSNIAFALARAGIGKLILIDFDRVDISNLNRQQYKASQTGMPKTEALTENLMEIAPYLAVSSHTVKLTENNAKTLLSDADIICEAFDKAEEKAMLVNHTLETMPEKYLIAASGMAGLGSSNDIQTRKAADRFYLCGDNVSGTDCGMGLIASRVMLCAAHQAHMALRILSGNYDI